MPEMVPLCAKAVVTRERKVRVMRFTMMDSTRGFFGYRSRNDFLAWMKREETRVVRSFNE